MPRRKPIGSFLDAAAAASKEDIMIKATKDAHEHRGDGLTSHLDNIVGKERHGSEPSTIAPGLSLLLSCAQLKPANLTLDTKQAVTAEPSLDITLTKTILTLDSHQLDTPYRIDMEAPLPTGRIGRVKYTEPSLFAADNVMEQRAVHMTLSTRTQAHDDNQSACSTPQPTGRRSFMQAAHEQASSTDANLLALSPFPSSTMPHPSSQTLNSTNNMRGKWPVSRNESGAVPDSELVFTGRRSNNNNNNSGDANSHQIPAMGSTATPKSKVERSALTPKSANVKPSGLNTSNKQAHAGSWNDQPAMNSWAQTEPWAEAHDTAAQVSDHWSIADLANCFNSAKPSPRKKKRNHGRKDNADSRDPQPATNLWEQANTPAAQSSGAWDTGHPPYSSASAKFRDEPQPYGSHLPVNPKTKGKSNLPRQSPWIKESDIPKGDPKRHRINWDSSSVPDDDSGRASSGWGTRKKADNEIGGAGLADWSGDIGPADIDWDNREKCRPFQTQGTIIEWQNKSLREFESLKKVKDAEAVEGTEEKPYAGGDDRVVDCIATLGAEVAPRYWIEALTKGQAPEVFWAEYITNIIDDDLEPADEDVFKSAVPWWMRYQDKESSILRSLDHPAIIGIDPSETEECRIWRENDFGSAKASENRKASEQEKRRANRERILAKRERAHKFSGTYDQTNTAMSPQHIKPDLKLFLRSASTEDMVQIRDIYNRYVDNAFIVPNITRVTEKDMHKRWRATKDADLPFIVACQRGEKIKARNKHHNGGEDIITPDRVVGFACATPWDGEGGDTIYYSTVHMEIYVHAEFHMKKVGSCLADKMMGLLDTNFFERGGYDAVGDELQGIGRSRVVSNVLIRYPYHPQKVEKLAWVRKWLKKRFGFEKTADLPGIAYKFDEKYFMAPGHI